MHARTHKRVNRDIEGWAEGWTGGWLDERTGRQMDGASRPWDRRKGGRAEGQKDVCVVVMVVVVGGGDMCGGVGGNREEAWTCLWRMFVAHLCLGLAPLCRASSTRGTCAKTCV